MAHTILVALCLFYLLCSASLSSACGVCGVPKTPPAEAPPPSVSYGYCPKDTLKLGVCADVLGLVTVVIGSPPTSKCCGLLQGLTDLEAAVCLCTAIKANVLGIIKLEVPVALTLLLNVCSKTVPEGFVCA